MDGRIIRKLREMLEESGFRDVHLWAAQGYWRTDIRADVMRWEGKGVAQGRKDIRDGLPVQFGSWDTMTDCVRHGIQIERGRLSFFDVSAKETR